MNGELVSSSYDCTYQHDIYPGTDTVMLITSNGLKKDSSIKIFYLIKLPFPPPSINNFTPSYGNNGTLVEISGNFFADATEVSFGDLPAA